MHTLAAWRGLSVLMGVLGLTMATPPPVRNVFAPYNVYDDVVGPSYPVEDEEEHTVADPCAGLSARDLKHAPGPCQNERGFVIRSVRERGWQLKYASAERQADAAVVLEAVKSEGTALQYASASLRSDAIIVMSAVTRDWQSIVFASPELKADPEIVLRAVRQHGRALQMAPAAVRSKFEVAEAAVTQDGLALEHVPSDAHCFVLEMKAVTQNPEALRFVSKDQLEPGQLEELSLAAVLRNGDSLKVGPSSSARPSLRSQW